jgi:hypothetical protein
VVLDLDGNGHFNANIHCYGDPDGDFDSDADVHLDPYGDEYEDIDSN